VTGRLILGWLAWTCAAAGAGAAQTPADARDQIAVGRYREAEAVIRRRLAAGPTVGTWHILLGEVLQRTGRWDEAGRAYQAAREAGGPDTLTAILGAGEVDLRLGRTDAARATFRRFIVWYNRGVATSSADLTAIAAALQHLGRRDHRFLRDALRAYDEAIAADSANIDAYIRLGDLFLEKYNGSDARAMYSTALARNPGHAGALLGMARSQRFDGQSDPVATVERALQVNPNLVPARVFLAAQYLELERYHLAAEEAEKALTVNPNDAPALTMLAAAGLLRGDEAEFERRLAAARAAAPGDADVFVTLAEVCARNRLYARAVKLAGRAIAIDSLSWRGYAVRGTNRLRTGEIAAGRRDLEVAFEGDPYDVWTKNTLDLLDQVDEFRVVRTDRFELVIPSSEADLLALYLGPLAERAYDSLSARYGVTPPTPIRIEVYPRHADFSVRTVGLVGLGALGVSFGPVIAMDAPSARPAGEFHWGATLWHELAHSFHMAASDFRVPRWFTEGLAVFEERRAGAGWGDRVTPEFLLAYKEGKLAAVTDMNQGFMRPKYPQQIIFSYYQASLIFEYIDDDWGFDAIRGLLAAFRGGADTPTAVRDVLGVGLDELADRFDRWFRARFAGPLAALKPAEDAPLTLEALRARVADTTDFLAQWRVGESLFRADDLDRAVPLLERARRLFPEYAGGNSPYWLLAQASAKQGQATKAVAELSALTALNRGHYPALMELARRRAVMGDTAGSARAMDDAMYVDPYEVEAHRTLATLYDALDRNTPAVRERRAVVALGPFNRSEALYQLAAAQFRAGDRAGARRSVLRALEDAPNYQEALDLLLRIRAGGGSR